MLISMPQVASSIVGVVQAITSSILLLPPPPSGVVWDKETSPFNRRQRFLSQNLVNTGRLRGFMPQLTRKSYG